jgi:hypothetical protein
MNIGVFTGSRRRDVDVLFALRPRLGLGPFGVGGEPIIALGNLLEGHLSSLVPHLRGHGARLFGAIMPVFRVEKKLVGRGDPHLRNNHYALWFGALSNDGSSRKR